MASLTEEAREASLEWARSTDGRYTTAFEFQCYERGYIAGAISRENVVKELTGAVARWVLENESSILNEEGWTVVDTDKKGDSPRYWLMCPPVAFPSNGDIE